MAKGHRIEIYINDILFSILEDYQVGQFDLNGQIALQLHSGAGPVKLQFRNIKLEDHGESKAETGEKKKPKKEKGVVPKDAPNIGFEKGNLTGWKVAGNIKALPTKTGAVAARGLPGSNADGKFWIGTYENGNMDGPRGELTSKTFRVTHPWGGLLVGGGSGNETRVEIVDDSSKKVIATFKGAQNESMTRMAVNLQKYKGKKIFVRVVDKASGGWGHINYDDFRFYNKKPKAYSGNAGGGRLASSPLLWHLKKNPNQEDLHETAKGMFVPEGFEVSTVASEPVIRQPIAFDFDAKGRIWVAESVQYPRVAKKGEGKDRIVILEDKDGDGTYETKKVFLDKLEFISGFAIGYGGVFVSSAPDLFFVADKDGDDKPDGPRKVLWTGFNTADTHETPNSFMWGNDGWLYGCHGMYNPSHVFDPKKPNEKLYIESCVWRLHPVTNKFEVYANGGSNQWGLDYNQYGDMFMTHCRSAWGLGPVTQVFRDGHYWAQQNKNHKPFVAAPPKGYRQYEIGENLFFKSIAAYGHGEGGAGFRGSKFIFGGHSHVGTMVYLGDNWPDEYRGQLYTMNLHGSQMNRELMFQKDSAWFSHSYGRDQLYSDDPEFLGVHLKYGPDGAVYFSDWADKQQCHNKRFEIWNRTNGRIFRMAWKATDKRVKVDLNSASNKKLVGYLSHKNQWFSHMAQHVLRQRRAAGKSTSDVVGELEKLTLDTANPNRFRALVALDAAGGLKPALIAKLLADKDQHIVKQTIIYATESKLSDSKLGEQLVKLAGTTPSAVVRLHLALAAQNRIAEPYARQIVETLAMRPEDADDRFVGKAIWFAYHKYAEQDGTAALSLAKKTPLPQLMRGIFWNQAKKDLSGVMAAALELKSDQQAGDIVSMILLLHQSTKKLDVPEDWKALKKRALASKNPNIEQHVKDLDGRFTGKVIVKDKVEVIGKPIAGAREVKIDCVRSLKYAQKSIGVKAGEAIKLVFTNKDGIPHNVVIVDQGAAEKVGKAADKMAGQADAVDKHYVPDMPEVLAASPVLAAEQKCIIYFRAPKKAGDYPFICTFPGHWRAMSGVVKVN